MTELTLDNQHVYRLGGRVLPGVTQIIRSCISGWQAGEWYLQRGQAVHAAIHLHLQGRLDRSSLDPRIEGRVRAIIAFLEQTKLEPLAVEWRLASEKYQFAGTLDFYARRRNPAGFFLVDWKSTLTPEVRVQLGAYSLLLKESGSNPITTAVAVEARDDETFKCGYYIAAELRAGEQTFLAMLTVHNFKKRHNLNPKGSNGDGSSSPG